MSAFTKSTSTLVPFSSKSRRRGINPSAAFLLAALTCAVLHLQSCGGGSGGGGGGSLKPRPDYRTGNSISLVLSAAAEPIEGASVGGNSATTDSNGVAIGTVTPAGAGWLEVKAPGYATTYAKQVGADLRGKKLFESTLTAVGATVVLDMTGARSVAVSDGANLVVKADLPTGLFHVNNATVKLTRVEATRSVPIYDLDVAGKQLFLQSAFSLEAMDMQGAPVFPVKPTRVTIRDEGALTSSMTLAVFDPVNGVWNIVKSACQRADAKHVVCTIPSFGIFGMFDTKPLSFLGVRFGPPGSPRSEPASDPTEAAYQAGRYHAHLRLPGDRYSKSEKDAAAREFAKAVRDYAAAHVDERAKTRLLFANQFINRWHPSADIDLMPDAAAVWEKLVEKIVATDPDCDQLDELMALEAQRQGFLDGAVSDAKIEDLHDVIRALQLRCKLLWKGTIHYRFHLEDKFPLLGRGKYEIWPSSQRNWQETHHVSISAEIDPNTGKLTGKIEGTDFVDVVLLPVMYRYDIPDGTKCGDDHHDFELPKMPVLAATTLYFDFDGSFDGNRFTIGAFEMDTNRSSQIVIKRRTLLEFWLDNPCRKTKQDSTITTVISYRSMLVGGFMGTPESPSLEMMLNTGTKTTQGDVVTISGRLELSPKIPPGIYPFEKATVSWRFTNVSDPIQ